MTHPINETFLQRRVRLKAERDAAERPQPVSDGTSALRVAADDPRASAWVQAKLDAQLEHVASAPEGERNSTLNAAAYSLGRLIPTYLQARPVAYALKNAALAAGLEEGEARATIRSGLNGGMNNPRDVTLTDAPGRDLASLVVGGARTAPIRVDPQTGEVLELDDDAALRLLVHERIIPLDWHALWADDSEEEWIVEPLLPARRLVALYSAPKVGKSLLMLEIAAAVARGAQVLGMTPDRARRVLYVDFENDPKADVRERLQAMGLGPDQLADLIYLSFPTIAALDSDRGGRELLAVVTEHACEVVVVDTVSRSIAGEENENDTWLSFYRHTGLRLKQEGVALIRLDHSGKDETKGQRGGSAKSGDVDAVWRMSRVTDDTYRLDCEAARMPVAERVLVLHRKQAPLRHVVDAQGRTAAFEARVGALVKALDELDAPRDIGRKNAAKLLRDKGLKAGTNPLAEALRRRSQGVLGLLGHPPLNEVSQQVWGHPGTPEES